MTTKNDIQKVLKFITQNKAITKIDEIMAEFPELSSNIFKNPDITKALENNKIKMQSALKIKLFKSNTNLHILSSFIFLIILYQKILKKSIK